MGDEINRDPIGERGGLNLYGFIHNDPINRIDPFGLEDRKECKDCEKQDNPAKDLFKMAADTLAGEVGGAGGGVVRLLLLAADAKQGCGDMKAAGETCNNFARNPSQDGAYQCCMAIMTSFPGLGGWSYFKCHSLSATF